MGSEQFGEMQGPDIPGKQWVRLTSRGDSLAMLVSDKCMTCIYEMKQEGSWSKVFTVQPRIDAAHLPKNIWENDMIVFELTETSQLVLYDPTTSQVTDLGIQLRLIGCCVFNYQIGEQTATGMDGHCPLPGDIVVDILSRLPVCVSNVCASSTGFLSSKVRVSKRSIFIRRTIVPVSSFKVAMAQHFFCLGSVNVTVGAKEERMMMTGMHTVVDIFCVGCGSIVSWKYESAHDKTQKYKEGKFILERFKVAGPDGSLYTVSHDDELGSDDEP